MRRYNVFMDTTRLVKLARSVANNLPHHWKHVSFILERNSVVSIGWNQPFKTHPLAHKYAYRYSAIHSELHAIVSYSGQISDFKRLKMVNIRIDKNGDTKNSKPCKRCQELLISFGFKEVFYSNSCGGFAKW